MSYWRGLKGYKLAFTGTANWDIWANDEGKCIALAKLNSGASDSHFGDLNHIRRLIAQGYFDGTPTEYGLTLLSGMYTAILSNGVKILRLKS